MFSKKKSWQEPKPEQYGCLRGGALGIECGPTEWWFLPGCHHVGGTARVCGPCKQEIDRGNHVPGPFECPCGAPPILTDSAA